MLLSFDKNQVSSSTFLILRVIRLNVTADNSIKRSPSDRIEKSSSTSNAHNIMKARRVLLYVSRQLTTSTRLRTSLLGRGHRSAYHFAVTNRLVIKGLPRLTRVLKSIHVKGILMRIHRTRVTPKGKFNAGRGPSKAMVLSRIGRPQNAGRIPVTNSSKRVFVYQINHSLAGRVPRKLIPIISRSGRLQRHYPPSLG